MATHRRLWATTLSATVLVVLPLGRGPLAPAPARADSACDGLADGTPCDDNGDGCFYDDGRDKCLAGVCASPPPCDRTTFTPLADGRVQMDWSKDPALVTSGEFCEGKASVPVELVTELTGVVPPSQNGLVQVTRARRARKDVPPTGKVRLKLVLNNLGRLLRRQRNPTGQLQVLVRMALSKPNGGPTVAANRVVSITARRR